MKTIMNTMLTTICLVIYSIVSAGEAPKIDREKGKDGLWGIAFEADGYKDISSRECLTCQKIEAKGTYKGKSVGFILKFKRNLEHHYNDSTVQPVGFISLISSDAEGANLLWALKDLFRSTSKKEKWKSIVDYPVFESPEFSSNISKSLMNTDFRSGKTELFLKNAIGTQNILRITVLKDQATIWIDEIDIKNRNLILDLISG